MSHDPSSISQFGRPLDVGSEAPGEGRDARREADSEDARRFGEMMRRQDGTAEPAPAADAKPSPFDLFRPAHLQSPPPLGGDALAGATDLRTIAEAVVERLLVSDGDTPGSQEVRIQLKDSVLPGTEIRIRQERGNIVVEFVCANADSVRFLDGQRDGLANLLGSRLKDLVEVMVTTADDTAAGDRQDGRSRQQYVAADDLPGTGKP